MKRRKLYVIERAGRGKWLPTWWTEDNPPEGDDDDEGGPPPTPVGNSKARKALRTAQECYPKYRYRITEVGEHDSTETK